MVHGVIVSRSHVGLICSLSWTVTATLRSPNVLIGGSDRVP